MWEICFFSFWWLLLGSKFHNAAIIIDRFVFNLFPASGKNDFAKE